MHSRILQQTTLYDTDFEKTIVIIMRVLKIIPVIMDILYKDEVKPLKRKNIYLTNKKPDVTIVSIVIILNSICKEKDRFELAGQIREETGTFCNTEPDSLSSGRLCHRIRRDVSDAWTAGLDHPGTDADRKRAGVETHFVGARPADNETDIAPVPCAPVLFAGNGAWAHLGDIPI